VEDGADRQLAVDGNRARFALAILDGSDASLLPHVQAGLPEDLDALEPLAPEIEASILRKERDAAGIDVGPWAGRHQRHSRLLARALGLVVGHRDLHGDVVGRLRRTYELAIRSRGPAFGEAAADDAVSEGNGFAPLGCLQDFTLGGRC